MHVLDFSPLQPEFTWAFFSLPDEEVARIQGVPVTRERLEGALQLAHLLRSEKPSSSLAGTYFRGALAEFASIDDVGSQELGGNLPLLRTNNPLPHILKLLRHVQLHLVSVGLTSDPMLLRWGLDAPEPFETPRWCVSDLDASHLGRLNAFQGPTPHYTAAQAGQMVAWFLEAQSHFGVPDLIYRAVLDVIARFGTTPPLPQ